MQLLLNLWAKIRLNRYRDPSLECSMTHLPSILSVGILLSSQSSAYSIFDTLRWWRLAGSNFSRPLSRPLPHHYLHPHFIPLSVIDGNVLPGLAPCHGIQPKARTAVRGTEGRKGDRRFEPYLCHCKSWSEFRLAKLYNSKVVTLDNITPHQPGL